MTLNASIRKATSAGPRALLGAALMLTLSFSYLRADGAEKVHFNKEIRPLLSDRCFTCHGPDDAKRKSGLRLDQREAALQPAKSGAVAIVPGKSSESELLKRITTHDEEDRMPPVKGNKSLSPQEVDTLRRWIDQGAEYQAHWAFIAPRRPEIPRTKKSKWIRNPIDAFVLARLESGKLSPSPEADRVTLIRRLSLDLTGLPPTATEIDQFVRDNSPGAYEKLVDRLLASSRYGEQMARTWLDAARYADTNGYNNDADRSMWPWRDWVIHAFNQNIPYSQFLTEQLAGDLLPTPTVDQLVASGFNRNGVFNTEGGIVEEEYRVEYVSDRVQTTSTVFMGLTMQCARCHDHKFDPISQKDFFAFYGLFNSIPDSPLSHSVNTPAEPFIRVPSPAQKQEEKQLLQAISDLELSIKQRREDSQQQSQLWAEALTEEEKRNLPETGPEISLNFEWAKDASPSTVRLQGITSLAADRFGTALSLSGEGHLESSTPTSIDTTNAYSISVWVKPESATSDHAILSKMDESAGMRGFDLLWEKGRIAAHLISKWPEQGLKIISEKTFPANQWHHVVFTYDGSSKGSGCRVYVNGVLEPIQISTDKLKGTLSTPQPIRIGIRTQNLAWKGLIDEVAVYRRILHADDVTTLAGGRVPESISSLLNIPKANRSPQQVQDIARFYMSHKDTLLAGLEKDRRSKQETLKSLQNKFPTTLIAKDLSPARPTFLLKRGAYDAPGEEVIPGTPSSLPPLPPQSQNNRLGLAQWLVSPSHPLTARVAVNRWWENYFGSGLVETTEDFGSQGSYPSHPELLDWLATELIRTGWNMKEMQKLLVMSATYRQQSKVSPALLEKDPKNRMLARGPRFRLPAEVVRDNALAVSGLLKESVGGPSVKPYQPPGLWEEVSVERRYTYVPDKGDGLYRRSLYTFWKRTCPPPTMMTFDAPDRETCVVRRARTSTPLQALILMNDPIYIEASRKLAERILQTGIQSEESILKETFKSIVSRLPSKRETEVLLNLYRQSRAEFTQHPSSAEKLLKVGDSPTAPEMDPIQLAAWTAVASTLLNTDEAITKF